MTKINNSSLISEVGYNQLNEELTVTMRKTPSTTYVFRGVNRKTADGLVAAKSAGTYFNTKIRGQFKSTKVVG
tara:strand:+ start:192 stop:410 length:219 start_codon:yes stop_codon:yes gene_type:complete